MRLDKNNPPHERRRSIRFDVLFPVMATDPNGVVLRLAGRDLSYGGLLVLSPTPFKDLAILRLSLRLPDWRGELPIQTRAIVVRCTPSREESRYPWQVGMLFHHLSEEAREEINIYLGVQKARLHHLETSGEASNP